MSRRFLPRRIASLCIPICAGLVFLNVVPAYSEGIQLAAFWYSPAFPDSYTTITFRIANVGTTPVYIPKILLSLSWAPAISYGAAGPTQTINVGSYNDFPITFYVPKEIVVDKGHDAQLIITYHEFGSAGNIVEGTLWLTLSIYVNRLAAVTTRETTKTVLTEVTKASTTTETIFTQPPPKPESPPEQSPDLKWIAGTAISVFAIVFGYYQWYSPRKDVRKKDVYEAIKEWIDLPITKFNDQRDTLPLAEKPPKLAKEIEECLRRNYASLWTDLQKFKQEYGG